VASIDRRSILSFLTLEPPKHPSDLVGISYALRVAQFQKSQAKLVRASDHQLSPGVNQ
jgi:hypothetical protein